MGIQNLLLIQIIKRCFGKLSMTKTKLVTLWDEDLRFALVCMLLVLTLVLGIFVGAKVEKNTQTLSVNLGQSPMQDNAPLPPLNLRGGEGELGGER